MKSKLGAEYTTKLESGLSSAMSSVRNRLMGGKISIPEQPQEMGRLIRHFKAQAKKQELKGVIQDVGLRKSNNIWVKDMDDKLRMLEDNFGDLEEHLEDPEAFEAKLGIPISKSARAVVPYSKKIKKENKEEQKQLREKAEAWVTEKRKEADEIEASRQ